MKQWKSARMLWNRVGPSTSDFFAELSSALAEIKEKELLGYLSHVEPLCFIQALGDLLNGTVQSGHHLNHGCMTEVSPDRAVQAQPPMVIRCVSHIISAPSGRYNYADYYSMKCEAVWKDVG